MNPSFGSLDSRPTAPVPARKADCRFLMSCNCLWAYVMLISSFEAARRHADGGHLADE